MGNEIVEALAALVGAAGRETNESEWLTVGECGKKFKVSRWTLLRWRKAGKIKGKKLTPGKSGKVLINASSVRAYIATLPEFYQE